MYVIDRDFGFAPNPFHGYCTLATCKPAIRAKAEIDDWVIGMGGTRLKATGRCVFAMRVTDVMSLGEYWDNPLFLDKRPVRNGSQKMLVGDNIYRRGPSGEWYQANSHHSNPDGTPNLYNMERDTKADRALISHHFLYFGREAPSVPATLLTETGFRNGRYNRVFDYETCASLLAWLSNFKSQVNVVVADPFDFDHGEKRYSAKSNRVS